MHSFTRDNTSFKGYVPQSNMRFNENAKVPSQEKKRISHVYSMRRRFKWCIDGYKYLKVDDQCGVSGQLFSCNNAIWRFVIYPGGVFRTDYVSISLVKVSGEETLMIARQKLSIVHQNMLKHAIELNFLYKHNGEENGITCWILKAEINGILSDTGSLTIQGEVEVGIFDKMLKGASNDETIQLDAQNDSTLNNLSVNMVSLFENKNCADIVLVAEGLETKAHKGVLIARSPVFAAMLNSEMLEAKEKRVTIPDIKKEIIDEFLYFIYAGKTRSLTTEIAMELYEVADKYAVEELQKSCSRFLRSNFADDNVSSVLLLAHKHSDQPLKEAAQHYIKLHVSDVIKTPGWSKAIEAEPCIANEILRNVVSYYVL